MEQTSTTIRIQLVGARTYATIRNTYSAGQVYEVTPSQWEEMQGYVHPVTGEAIFMEADEVAQRMHAEEVADDLAAVGLGDSGERDTALEALGVVTLPPDPPEAPEVPAGASKAPAKAPAKPVTAHPPAKRKIVVGGGKPNDPVIV